MKKRTKKYAEGGLAGLAENAQSLMGDVDNMASTINYGSSTPAIGSSKTDPVGFNAVAGLKKGGAVSSASSRGDGCAMRGKTRGRMV
jgi:hypothetical protein